MSGARRNASRTAGMLFMFCGNLWRANAESSTARIQNNTAWAWLRFQPKSRLALWYPKKLGQATAGCGRFALSRWRESVLAVPRSRSSAGGRRAARITLSALRFRHAWRERARHCYRVSRVTLLAPFVKRSPLLSLASATPLADAQSSGVRQRSFRFESKRKMSMPAQARRRATLGGSEAPRSHPRRRSA